MSESNKDLTLSLKVMLNKEKNKVHFAEADGHFVDILLTFLTLPLGRIIKVLEKHYGDDEVPTIGSLNTLYRSLANLDTAHFVTEGAKQSLLNPTSSFEAEYEGLKLNITDFQPVKYFCCASQPQTHRRFRILSIYYNKMETCRNIELYPCGAKMNKTVTKKGWQSSSGDGVFTINTESFIISDNLQILPNETGLLGTISYLGITDMDNAEKIKVDLGFSEIMKLLKASFTSPTPLSDVILNKTTHMNYSTVVESHQANTAKKESPNSKNISLKAMIQKSTGKFLYAQVQKDFMEFLFSLHYIPLGGVEHLLSGNTCFKAIDNLYRTTSDLIDSKHFKNPNMKEGLMNPNLPHGYISKDHILPLTEQRLPTDYTDRCKWISSVKFPNGKGNYLKGSPTYHVADDLTVTPFCIASTLSFLREQKILISDVKEVELQIGLKEALSILKASLTSTTALTDALLSRISLKQPKTEV